MQGMHEYIGAIIYEVEETEKVAREVLGNIGQIKGIVHKASDVNGATQAVLVKRSGTRSRDGSEVEGNRRLRVSLYSETQGLESRAVESEA